MEQIILKMIDFDHGDSKRIQHFIKVYEFAKLIATNENLDDKTKDTLLITAIVHDIAIIPCEKEFGYSSGKTQEKYGPQYAKQLLKDDKNISDEQLDRICFLIAHHHTYNNINDLDYQILVEADFLVNAFEDNLEKETIIKFKNKVFKTKTGINILNTMYDL